MESGTTPLQPRARVARRSVVVAIAALAAFLALTIAVLFSPAFQALDVRASAALRDLSVPAIDVLARILTFIGNPWPMTVLTISGAVWLLLVGRRGEALLLAATMALGSGTGAIIKRLVERARPDAELARIPLPESFSFPSGHALSSMLFFGTAALFIVVLARSSRFRLWGPIVCAALAIGIALSRVYLGVHYLGDIIASWMLGSALLAVTAEAYALWVRRAKG